MMPDARLSPLLFVGKINRGGWVISGGNAFRARGFAGLVSELPVKKLTVMGENCYEIELLGVDRSKTLQWIVIALDENIIIVDDKTIEIRFGNGVELRFTNNNAGTHELADTFSENAETKKEEVEIRYTPSSSKAVVQMRSVEPKEAEVGDLQPTRGEDYDERKQIAQCFDKFCKETLGECRSFNLSDYQEYKKYKVLEARELEFIEYLVGWGGLTFKDGVYTITDKFAGLLEKFAKGVMA